MIVQWCTSITSIEYELRPIERIDNPKLAEVIRSVMPEFGAMGAGFSIQDPEVDDMFNSYSQPRSAYFVIVSDGKVVGGGGVASLTDGPHHVCELRKMYLLKSARKQGIGKILLEKCLGRAQEFDFKLCYLETLKSMTGSRALYERSGLEPLAGPMGNTGHFGCDSWYIKLL